MTDTTTPAKEGMNGVNKDGGGDNAATKTTSTIMKELHDVVGRTSFFALVFFRASMQECYPGLYVGNSEAAKDTVYLKKHGITHVLNAAQGKGFTMVDLHADYYHDHCISYLGFQLVDVATTQISSHFEEGAKFIDNALASGGKVLVFCLMGRSRSASLACAFLMLRRGLGAAQALATIRKKRPAARPNDGFLEQLADLDIRLMKDRGML